MDFREPTVKWAGVGSRKAPYRMLQWARRIGAELARQNMTCRSGGADGMDRAFEDGVCSVDPWLTEIWLPWENFNYHGSTHWGPTDQALKIAEMLHPAWNRLTDREQMLHGRNSHIMLGAGLDDPVQFAVLWTPGGQTVGGTGQAIRIAQHYGIPIYNLETMPLSAVTIPF